MHHHARGLVDDSEVLVFVDHGEWNLLGSGLGRICLRNLEVHDIARDHTVRRICGPAVDADQVTLDETRGRGPAEVAGVLSEKAVEPRGRSLRDQPAGLLRRT